MALMVVLHQGQKLQLEAAETGEHPHLEASARSFLMEAALVAAPMLSELKDWICQRRCI